MSSDALVRRIDHLSVAVSRPDEVFSVLTGELGLPPYFPPARFPGFTSGAVALGNTFLETILWASGRRSRLPHDAGAICVALEPADDISWAEQELDRRGIAHSMPFGYAGSGTGAPSNPQVPWESGKGPLWTTMMLGGLMGDQLLARRFAREARTPRATRAVSRGTAALATRSNTVGDLVMSRVLPPTAYPFLCEWHRIDLEQGRTVVRDLLAEASGGPLRVTGMREIVIGVADLALERGRWDALLAPLAADEASRWAFGGGPAIRLEQSASAPWQRLVLDVSSLAVASAALEERGMLGARTGEEVSVDPRHLAGLDLRLREAAK